jgi:hypothetical protein
MHRCVQYDMTRSEWRGKRCRNWQFVYNRKKNNSVRFF